ncbi:N-acetylneuraminate synthase family protein [Candidatus Peregrinibacteria bacterium]|nr:N-acetylneuraminate synthase family protein [Candidatus Peregrinibacteria bacterium]
MRTFIIAEFGMLHEGSFGNACCMADVAKKCGADAVKFQTHIAEAETLLNAPMPSFFKGEPRWDYFKRTAFTLEQWKALKAHCDKIGIEFMSSPFSIEAVELLEQVGMARYKIPSGEVTNIPFLERVGETGKPVLLSSGMSNWEELDEAVSALKKSGASDLTVMQCTSLYPTPPEKIGLNVMLEMKERYKCPVGLSDQSLTNYAGFAAAALGASIIEKHATLSKHCYGSDAKHSIEPDEFKDFVRGIRDIEKMLANPVDKNDLSAYKDMKRVFEKSIVAECDIPKGAVIIREHLGLKKPRGGLQPKFLNSIIGRKTKSNIKQNQQITASDIEI